MARRTKAWLTPDAGDTSVVRGCLEIPAPLLPMVTGALSALTEIWNWQAFGTMTPEDAAEAATRMLLAFEDGTCSDMNCEDVLNCVLPYLQASLYDDATIRLEPTTEQPQVSYDGGTTWTDIPQSGDGTINAPQPQPTTGANDDAKICLASSRAALVIAEFYKQTFGAFTADVMNALGTANSFLQDIKLLLFNAIYSPYDGIIEAAGFLEQDFETNYTAGTLSETNIEDLLCLLVNSASVDLDGVVTFDFGAVAANVITQVGTNPGTAIWFLLQNMQSAGLNAAASTGITDTPLDCAPCMPEWCHEFDFTVDQQGFAVSPGWAGQWLTASPPLGNGWYSVPSSGPSYRLSIYIDFETTLIESVELTYRVGQVASGGYRAIDLFNGVYTPGNEVASQPLNTGSTGDTFITTELETSVYADRLRLWLDTDEVSSGSYNTIRSVVVRGRGVNPWTDNC